MFAISGLRIFTSKGVFTLEEADGIVRASNGFHYRNETWPSKKDAILGLAHWYFDQLMETRETTWLLQNEKGVHRFFRNQGEDWVTSIDLTRWVGVETIPLTELEKEYLSYAREYAASQPPFDD